MSEDTPLPTPSFTPSRTISKTVNAPIATPGKYKPKQSFWVFLIACYISFVTSFFNKK